MRIRTGDVDQLPSTPGTAKLNMTASPLGGTFGLVPSSGTKVHQGWDLYATPGTPADAITEGVVEYTANVGDYGMQLCLKLNDSVVQKYCRNHFIGDLYAFYGHLLFALKKKGDLVAEGDTVALTGNSGNATNTPPHLHFEIRTTPHPGLGLGGRINPEELFGQTYYRCWQ
jgi:murein DD-endopeptidase MepM/ murein hydrolase activator NlpD